MELNPAAVPDASRTAPAPVPGKAHRIHVEIGELVLDGFGHLDSDRVADAFQRELTRLVARRGVPLAADGDQGVDLLTGLPALPATTSPVRLGEALARAVHAGLTGRGTSGGGRP